MTLLDARIHATVGGFLLRAEMKAADGSTIALLGPNGSGKSTFVRALAGLLPNVHGAIDVDGMRWLEQPGGIDLMPQQRSAGIVFQNLALFPYMTGAENVAYGPRARGERRRSADRIAMETLELVGAAHLARRAVRGLSGGEAQKVALARALVLKPRLLLLDEPLSSLDIESRAEMRHLLLSILRGFEGTRIVVTHDPIDAFALADALAIMENGRIVQMGSRADIGLRPRSRYAARFAGVNLVRGTLVTSGGSTSLRTGDAEIIVLSEDIPAGAAVFGTFPTNAVTLSTTRPSGSARNTFSVVVDRVELREGRARVRLRGPVEMTAEITVASAAALEARPGAMLWAAIKATEIDVYRD
ncbi:MAG: ABC transporter ATP-binding protein [Actinomycetota bacterium]